MKNYMKFLVFTLTMFSVSLTSFAQDKIIPASELPNEIKSYLSKHFPNNSILQAQVDKELFSTSYEVILQDNFSLEFDSKNRVTDISGKSQLPNSVIPKSILEYVKSNYPNNIILDWELDDKNQQIELDNGLDLEFNMQGAFLRIDG